MGTKKDEALADIYEELSKKHSCIDLLNRLGFRVEPQMVVKNMTYKDLLTDLDLKPTYKEDRVDLEFRTRPFKTIIWVNLGHFEDVEHDYEELRHKVLMILKKRDISIDTFLTEASQPQHAQPIKTQSE